MKNVNIQIIFPLSKNIEADCNKEQSILDYYKIQNKIAIDDNFKIKTLDSNQLLVEQCSCIVCLLNKNEGRCRAVAEYARLMGRDVLKIEV